MYQIKILNALVQSSDNVEIRRTMSRLTDEYELIFTRPEALQFWILIKNHFFRHLSIPNPTFLDSYFSGEKASDLSKFWHTEVKPNNDINSDDISQYVDLQKNYTIKLRVSQLVSDANSDLISTTDSQIKDYISNFYQGVSELFTKVNSEDKRILSSHDSEKITGSYKSRFKEAKELTETTAKWNIPQIDAESKIRKTDFVVIGGFVGSGKSTLVRQMAYNRIIHNKSQEYFVSSEMTADEVMDYFISIHSENSKFSGRKPLSVNDIIDNNLSEKDQEFLLEVTDDFLNNEEYGALTVFESKSVNTTVQTIVADIILHHLTVQKIDCITWDYFTNLRIFPDKTAKPEDYNAEIASVKQIFTSLRIPNIVNAQINRQGEKDFQKLGYHTIDSLSTYNELERSATQIFTIGRLEDDVKAGRFYIEALKNRYGKLFEPFHLYQSQVTGGLVDISGDREDINNVVDILSSIEF